MLGVDTVELYPLVIIVTVCDGKDVRAEAVTGALPGEQPGKAGAALPKGGATVSRLGDLRDLVMSNKGWWHNSLMLVVTGRWLIHMNDG